MRFSVNPTFALKQSRKLHSDGRGLGMYGTRADPAFNRTSPQAGRRFSRSEIKNHSRRSVPWQ
jgi:hypothetical protein